MRTPREGGRAQLRTAGFIAAIVPVLLAALPGGAVSAQEQDLDDRLTPIAENVAEGLRVTAEARTPLQPGVVMVVAGGVYDTTGAAIPAPITIDFDGFADGIVLGRLDATTGSPLGAAWECAADVASCTLVSSETSAPVALAAGELAPWRLVLNVDPDAVVADGSSLVSTATAGVEGTNAFVRSEPLTVDLPAGDLDSGALNADGDVALLATFETPAAVSPGRSITTTVSLIDLVGAEDADGATSVSVSGLLPAVLSSWTSASPEWTCVGQDADEPTCTWTGSAAAGEELPTLSVTGVVDRAFDQQDAVAWSSTVATSDGVVITEDHLASIAPPPPPSATLSASIAGSIAVSSPGMAVVDVAVSTLALVDGPLEVNASLPDGVTIDDELVEAPWACSDESSEATCAIAFADLDPIDDLAHAGQLRLPLSVSADAAGGLAQIDLTVAVPGESEEHLHDNATSVSIAISDGEQPVLDVLASAVLNDGTVEIIVDGRHSQVTEGEQIALTPHNRGSGSITSGTNVQLSVTTPNSVDIEWLDQSWNCGSELIGTAAFPVGMRTQCTLQVDTEIGPDGQLPALVGTVMEAHRGQDAGEWPVAAELMHSDNTPLAASSLPASLMVDVVPTVTKLALSAASSTVRTGGSGTIELLVENMGDSPASEVTIVVSLGDGLQFNESSIECDVHRLVDDGPLRNIVDPSVIECALTEPVPAGGSATVQLDVSTDSTDASRTLTASAVVRAPDMLDNAPITVGIDLQSPLVAMAQAVPETATAVDQTVTLDGRLSEGGAASYAWRQVPANDSDVIETPIAWVGSTTSRVVQFERPNVAVDATLRFELSVSDGIDTVTDVVDVTVLAASDATPSSSADVTVASSPQVATLDGGDSADDPDPTTADDSAPGDPGLVRGSGESVVSTELDIPNGVYRGIERNDYDAGSFGVGASAQNYDPIDVAVSDFSRRLPYAVDGSLIEQNGFPEWSRGGVWQDTDFLGFFVCDAPSTACVFDQFGTPSTYGRVFTVPDDIADGGTVEARFAADDGGTPVGDYTVEFAVLDRVPFNSSLPVINGSAGSLGSSVQVSNGSWYFAPTSYTYQWMSCTDETDVESCTDIDGATSDQFVPTATEFGAFLRVAMTATNALGSSIALHDPVSDAVAAFVDPVIELTRSTVTSPVEGTPASLNVGTYLPSNVTAAVNFWMVCVTANSSCEQSPGATGATYTPTEHDAGRYLLATYTMTAADGSSNYYATAGAQVAGATVVNTAPPVLTGPASSTATQRYTASSGTWSNTNSTTTTTYEFRRCASASTPLSSCTTVRTAGSSAGYDLVPDDIGAYLAVVVTLKNQYALAVEAVTRTGEPIAAPPPTPITTPSITAPSTAIGGTVSVTSNGTWEWGGSNSDIQWQRCTAAGSGCVDVDGETAGDYELTLADADAFLRVTVATTNQWGNTASSTSNVIGPVNVVVPTSLAEPTIVLPVGATEPHEGMEVTVDAGTWTSPSADPLTSNRTYQWERCDGDGCSAIVTGASYTITSADVDSRLKVTETVSTGLGVTASAASPESSTVLSGAPSLDEAPALSAAPLVAISLSVSSGSWTTWTGETPTFSYRWESCSVDLAECVDRVGTTTYTPLVADQGRRIVVAVEATNVYGTSTAATAASDPVALGSGPTVSTDAPGGVLDVVGGDLVVIVGSASGTGTLTSSWTQLTGTTVLETAIVGNELRFTAPDGLTDSLTFVYRATQPDEQFAEAIVHIDIVVDAAVTVDAPTDPLVGGEPTSLTAVGVGPEPHTYLWTQISGPEVLTDAVSGARLDFTPPSTGSATLEFQAQLITSDGQTASTLVDVDFTPPAVASTDLIGSYASIAGGETITITGAGSGTGEVAMQWTQTDGTTVLAGPVDGAELTVTAPATGRGSLAFTFTVTAEDGRTAAVDIDIDYAQPAGIDVITPTETATGGVELTLDARARGIAPFTYVWTQMSGPTVELGDADTEDLTITPPATGEGTLEFSVTVTTDDDQTDTATVSVDFTQSAVVTDVEPATADVLTGTTVRLSGTATALAPATSRWTQTGGTSVLTGASDGNAVDITVPSTGSGTLVFEFEVSGANGRTDARSVVVSFEEPPPTPAPVGLCDVVAAARAPGTTARLGDNIEISFAAVAVSARACSGDTTATFTGASLTLDGIFAITGASGSLDRSGITLTSGSMRIDDDDFDGLRFDLVGNGLTIEFGGTSFAAAGTFVTPGLALLDAPTGWSAATRVDFSVTDGSGTVTIDAVAHPAATVPIGVESGLPIIDDGDAALTFSGNWSSDGGIIATARVQGLVDLGTGPVTLTGSVQRADADSSLSVAISAAIPGRFEFADGIELSDVNVGWNDGTVTGDGLVTIAGSSSMLVSISFTDAQNWTVAIAGDPTAAPWDLIPGMTIEPARTSGSISRSGDTTTVSIELGADQWNAIQGVTVSDLDLAASVTCTTGRACTPEFSIRAGIAMNLGGVTLGGVVAGNIELATGAYDLSVSSLTPFSPFDGVSVTDVTGSMTRSANGARSTSLDGTAKIGDATGRLTLQFNANGWTTRLAVDRLTPFTGAPTLLNTTVLYSSAATSLTVDGESIALAAQTVTVVGTTTPPAWLTSLLGIPATQVDVRGSIGLASQEVDLTVRLAALGGVKLFDVAGVSIAVDQVDVTIGGRGTRITSNVEANAELQLPGIAGSSPTTVDVIVSIGVDPTAGEVNMSASLAPGERWDDVLGVSGLNVTGLAVSLQVALNGGGNPTVGLAGTATLPSFIADPLGIAPGTPVTLAARLGGVVDCFAFEIGDGSAQAIDVLNAGIITADSASFVMAPDGCRIGVYDFPAGISVGFDGEVLSVPAVVSVAVQPNTSSMSADIELGRVGFGGLAIDDVSVQFATSSVTQQIEFGGEVTVFGATARAEGEVIRTPTSTSTRFAGTFPGPSLGGFGLDDLEVEFVQSPASGEMSATGTTALDLFATQVDIDLDFEIRNGQITRANGTADVDLDLAAIALDGSLDLELVTGQFPEITFDGSIEALGVALADATGVVQPNGMRVAAQLGVDGLVDARLSGTIAYGFATGEDPKLVVSGGNAFAVEPGDFELVARGALLRVAGFDVNSVVELSSINGVTKASIDGSVYLGIGGTAAIVELSGELDTGGGLDLAGTGSIQVVGYELTDASFRARRDADGNDELTISGGFDLPGVGGIELAGTVRRTPQFGTLFQMHGAADVTIGGFELAGGQFVLFREVAPSGDSASSGAVAADRVARIRPLVAPECATAPCTVSAGLVGTAQFSAPAVSTMTVTVIATADGSMSFDATTRLGGAAGAAIGSPTVTMRFEASATGPALLTFNAVTNRAFGIPARFSVSGTISSSGSYTYVGAGSIDLASPTVDIGFARFRGAASGSFTVTARGSDAGAPRIGGDINVYAEAQLKHIKWNGRWSGWSKLFGAQLGGSISPVELELYIDVTGFGRVRLPFSF